jgi:hypothetical protein
MSYQVKLNTPYNISIEEPGVAGTPEPSIVYVWTYNGSSIGINSRFVPSFVFPSLPGTLSCTITLSNPAGTTSETVTASITEAPPQASLKNISIRLSTNEGVSLLKIDNSSVSSTVKVGGERNNNLLPEYTNVTTIGYQWYRNDSPIAGATQATYTITESDVNTVLKVEMTVSNEINSVTRSSKIMIGNPEIDFGDSKIGTHLGSWTSISRYSNSVPFVNLVYSSCNGVNTDDSFARTSSTTHTNLFNWNVLDWGTSPAIFTEDGWPYQTTNETNLSPSGTNFARLWLNSGEAKQWARWYAMLGLEGGYSDYTPKGPNANNRTPDVLFGSPNENRKFSYEVHTYWQGNGYAEASHSASSPQTEITPTQVLFSGPENKGPWGTDNDDVSINGPQNMWKVTKTYQSITDKSYGTAPGLFAFITRSTKPSVQPPPWDWNTGPTRNVMVMVGTVTDITDSENPVVVYSGFDHTTYKPFQAYPNWIKQYNNSGVLRSLTLGHARNYLLKTGDPTKTPVQSAPGPFNPVLDESQNQILLNHLPRSSNPNRQAELNISPDGSYQIWTAPLWEIQPVVNMGWSHSYPSGALMGHGPMCKPTYVCFGRSLRGLIELSNQIDADVWWNHMPYITFVGTKDEQGNITYAWNHGRSGAGSSGELTYPYDQTQVGDLLLDENYANGFIDVVDRYLNEGRKLYNEYGNEVWNFGTSYREMYDYAGTYANRMIASVSEGGDGHLLARSSSFLLQSPAWFEGTAITGVGRGTDELRNLYTGASTALLSRHMRQRLATNESSREVVAMMGGRINGNAAFQRSLSILFACMPDLFKELDAITIANYHAPSLQLGRIPEEPLLVNDFGKLAVDQQMNTPDNLRYKESPLVMMDTPLLPAPSVPPNKTPMWFSGSMQVEESAAGKGVSILKALTTKFIANDLSANFGNWNYDFAEGLNSITSARPNPVLPQSRPVGGLIATRENIPAGWPVNQRRWNLQLFAYEGGPYVETTNDDRKKTFHGVWTSPHIYHYMRRYYEAYFYPAFKSNTRSVVSEQEIGTTGITENQLYRENMVPDTHQMYGGRIFDVMTDMTTIACENNLFAHESFWDGHLDAPAHLAREHAAFFNIGEEGWENNYSLDAGL